MFDIKVLYFTILAALLTISPGADTFLVIRNSISNGLRAGLTTTLGICCGLFFHASLSAAGLSIIFIKSAKAYEALKVVGAIYLCFLGLLSIKRIFEKNNRNRNTGMSNSPYQVSKTNRTAFFEGLLNNICNPKPAVFYLALLPQFINPYDPVWAKSILLASIHFVMGLAWLSLIAFAVGKVKDMLSSSRTQLWLEAASGSVLIAFGLCLVFEER